MEPGLLSHIHLTSSIMLGSTDLCTCTLHPASILMTYPCTLESGVTQVVVHSDQAEAYICNILNLIEYMEISYFLRCCHLHIKIIWVTAWRWF